MNYLLIYNYNCVTKCFQIVIYFAIPQIKNAIHLSRTPLDRMDTTINHKA